MSPPGNRKPSDKLINKVHCGHALKVLRKFPASTVDCVVTSPPYFNQRDYGDARQIGAESTINDYVQQLAAVFAEIQRVLKPTGTLWLNLGDKYKRGQLLGMPWRVALNLIDQDWILRNEIIWHKPNAMPSPSRKRLTVDHETLFFFTRDDNYYYDADSIREPHVTFSSESRMKGGRKHFGKRGGTPEQGKNQGSSNLHDGRWDQAFHPAGRNKRTVWKIPLSKSRETHFAVFPTELVATCIRAGSPESGVVLDPFCGSGTTLAVADSLHRNWIGIDCSAEYCRMSRRRLLQKK